MRDIIFTRIAKRKVKKLRTCGGGHKLVILSDNVANVIDFDNKARKAEIKNVKSNNANDFFERRNIITKGAIIETELGNAVVTSRPNQDGVINAKLIKTK